MEDAMIRRFAWTLGIAILVLTAFVPVPARAGQEAAPAELAGTTPDAQPGCGAEVLDLSAEASICPAVQIGIPEPEFMARRGYCRCGCGATCTSDADCGPGGSCVKAISCC
jgi:hypothetical protein